MHAVEALGYIPLAKLVEWIENLSGIDCFAAIFNAAMPSPDIDFVGPSFQGWRSYIYITFTHYSGWCFIKSVTVIKSAGT